MERIVNCTVLRQGTRTWVCYATLRSVSVTTTSVATRDGEWDLPVKIHHHHTKQNSSLRPPILLVPGWSGVSEDWGAVPKLLAATGSDVVVFDPRYLGQARPTAIPKERTSLEEMADDVTVILDQIAADFYGSTVTPEFSIGGVSMGGLIAQLVVGTSLKKDAFEETKSLRDRLWKPHSMILMCTAPVSVRAGNRLRKFLESFSSWDEHPRKCAETFFSALGDDFLSKPGRYKLRDKLVETFLKSRSEFVAGDLGAGLELQKAALVEGLNEESGAAVLETVSKAVVPTCVLHGKDDRVVDFRNAFALQDALGGACEVHLLEGCDHLLWITHGTEIVRRISNFMETNKVAA